MEVDLPSQFQPETKEGVAKIASGIHLSSEDPRFTAGGDHGTRVSERCSWVSDDGEVRGEVHRGEMSLDGASL